MVFKYKVFPTSEAFEKFQNEHSVSIAQIIPLVSAVKFNVDSSTCEGVTDIASFVVFQENLEQQQSDSDIQQIKF